MIYIVLASPERWAGVASAVRSSRYHSGVGKSTAAHWNDVYAGQAVDAVSWFQARPETSRRLLVAATDRSGAAVIDVGAGASGLAEVLLDQGWTDVTVLDVAADALAVVRGRLAARSAVVSFVVADVLTWEPERQYDAWHDRAVFHFLVTAADRRRYVDTPARAVKPGGVLVLGTFACDGPTRCSGLPTARFDAEGLEPEFVSAFEGVRTEREEHRTPDGGVQSFTWVVLRRRAM